MLVLRLCVSAAFSLDSVGAVGSDPQTHLMPLLAEISERFLFKEEASKTLSYMLKTHTTQVMKRRRRGSPPLRLALRPHRSVRYQRCCDASPDADAQ